MVVILVFMLTPLYVGHAADTSTQAKIEQADSLYAQRDDPGDMEDKASARKLYQKHFPR